MPIVLKPYVMPIFVEGHPGILYWHGGRVMTTVRIDSAACTRSGWSPARQAIVFTSMTADQAVEHDFTIRLLTDTFAGSAEPSDDKV